MKAHIRGSGWLREGWQNKDKCRRAIFMEATRRQTRHKQTHKQGKFYQWHIKKYKSNEEEVINWNTPSCHSPPYVLDFIIPECGHPLKNWVPSSSHQCPAKCPRLTESTSGKWSFQFSGCWNKHDNPSRQQDDPRSTALLSDV